MKAPESALTLSSCIASALDQTHQGRGWNSATPARRVRGASLPNAPLAFLVLCCLSCESFAQSLTIWPLPPCGGYPSESRVGVGAMAHYFDFSPVAAVLTPQQLPFQMTSFAHDQTLTADQSAFLAQATATAEYTLTSSSLRIGFSLEEEHENETGPVTYSSAEGAIYFTINTAATCTVIASYAATGANGSNGGHFQFNLTKCANDGSFTSVRQIGQLVWSGNSTFSSGPSRDSLLSDGTYSISYDVSIGGTQGTKFGGSAVGLFQLTLTPLCLADLNHDGLVDDSDFVIFAQAYNILDCADPTMPVGCPSDLNSDSLVDDFDFVIFVQAYNDLLCP